MSKKRIFNGICIGFSLLLMIAVIMLAYYGRNAGTIYFQTSGNPADTVNAFYEAALHGKYDEAYSYLYDYSDLGLDFPKTSENSYLQNDFLSSDERIIEALQDSYHYRMIGEPVISKLNATQKVEFTYLDMNHFFDNVNARYYRILEDKVQTMPKREVFDDAGNYRLDVLEMVYEEAVEQSIQYANQYYSSKEYEVALVYEDRAWHILWNDQMKEGFLGR